jgi:hypothetical protein
VEWNARSWSAIRLASRDPVASTSVSKASLIAVSCSGLGTRETAAVSSRSRLLACGLGLSWPMIR